MESTRHRVYEPHLGEPAATDPLEVAILDKTRSHLITTGAFAALAAALILLFLPGGAGRGTVAGACAALAGHRVLLLIRRVRPLAKLLELPTVVLTPGPGQLRVSGTTVSIALPGPGPRWARARMPRSKQLVLARERRVFMLGPDRRGRLVLAAPGSIAGHFGRVRPTPAAGSGEPPAGTTVSAAFLGESQRRAALTIALAPVAGALVWVIAEMFPGGSPVGGAIGGGAAYLAFAIVRLVHVRRLARAARTGDWTELGATLDTPITPGSPGTGHATGRVTMPDGTVVHARFGRQPLDLLVNVRATGRLWVLGTPERGTAVVAGLPDHPVLGPVRLG
ncbi:hypothetical protein [Amycolatopsis thermophila]|uniref:PH domain-containing protein n=1 Tax=Amycolatopsis thermophila TaxID=206084 RepID=A0ABU0ERY4_9PSEU|nr:hypothetical protein [Amycolatopsis thermophila]MDQ0378047.1 hypothetical protein [Amycolatopsis thermophila]